MTDQPTSSSLHDDRQRRIRGRLVRFEAAPHRVVVYSTSTLPREATR